MTIIATHRVEFACQSSYGPFVGDRSFMLRIEAIPRGLPVNVLSLDEALAPFALAEWKLAVDFDTVTFVDPVDESEAEITCIDGEVYVQTKYLDIASAAYPDLTIHRAGSTEPVKLLNGNELVGVVMPILPPTDAERAA